MFCQLVRVKLLFQNHSLILRRFQGTISKNTFSNPAQSDLIFFNVIQLKRSVGRENMDSSLLSGCHFPRRLTDIVRRRYWNIKGNTNRTRHQKDQLLKCYFCLTHIIIICFLKSEYINITTVLWILYVLNSWNGHPSYRKSLWCHHLSAGSHK